MLRFLTPLKSTGGSPPPFNPGDLSGLTLWLDADNASTINTGSPVDMDPVDNWNDLSATMANFAQGTSIQRPVYIANTLNGKPGIAFTSTQVLTNSNNVIGDGTAPFTLYCIADFTAYTSGFAFIASFASGVSGSCPQLFFSNQVGTNNNYRFLCFGAAVAGSFGIVRTEDSFDTASTFYAMGLTYNGSGPGTGNYNFYGSNTALTTLAASDSSFTTAVNVLGALSSAGAFNIKGSVCEVILYNRVLNSTERGQIETYFTGKWGL